MEKNSEYVYTKSCDACFAVNHKGVLFCRMCGKSFEAERADSPINGLASKIARELNIINRDDFIVLNKILHKFIVSVNSATVISKRRFIEEPIEFVKSTKQEMRRLRHENLTDALENSNSLYVKEQRDQEGNYETVSTVYVLRGL